jgi:hypothetical protein
MERFFSQQQIADEYEATQRRSLGLTPVLLGLSRYLQPFLGDHQPACLIARNMRPLGVPAALVSMLSECFRPRNYRSRLV